MGLGLKRLQNIVNGRFAWALRACRLSGHSHTQPLFLELVLTYRCNLSCHYCYQDHSKAQRLGDMSLDDVIRIEQRIRRAFLIKPRILVFGGEPTQNKHFVQIMTYLSEQGYPLYLTTNGTGDGGQLEDIISLDGLKSVEFSLHQGNQDILPKLLDRIKAATRGNVPRISINCPVDHIIDSGRSFKEVVESFRPVGVDSISFQHAHIVNFKDLARYSPDFISQIIKIQKERHFTEVLFFPYVHKRDISRYYQDPTFPGKKKQCVLPWLDMVIHPNGDIVPCDEMDQVMGNIFNDDPRAVWNSEPYKKFRQSIMNPGMTREICQRCAHRHYM
jgi:radical SAM protein with 4Fe4S-binding SPASM domain